MIIQSPHIDINIRMRLRERFESFRRRDNAQEPDVLAAMLLQLIDRVDCRSAGREHRIDDEHIPLLNICRKLAVVFNRLKRLGITIKTDTDDEGFPQVPAFIKVITTMLAACASFLTVWVGIRRM